MNDSDNLGKYPNIKTDEEDPSESIVTKVAPPAISEQNDRRAVRSRSRRERPRKLRPLPSDHKGVVDRHPRFDAIEPDIESFVTSCLPGVTLTHNTSSQRSKPTRKRSLPSISFLSQKTFAAAEKKRRKEEQERQKVLAEEAAKKIMDSTMQALNETGVDGTLNKNEAAFQVNTETNVSTVTTRENASRSQNPENDPKAITTTTTTTFEGQSNVLMPPLLVEFLNSIRKHKDR
jgi:undecaprenyl pyrophosphate synthase